MSRPTASCKSTEKPDATPVQAKYDRNGEILKNRQQEKERD